MQITLRAARINVGLSQTEAAKKIGVTKDIISNWERAKSFPNAMQIKKIQDLYGVRYDDVIFLPTKTL